MIPEIELRDIQPKGSSDVPSSSHIQTGLPIPKTVRVQFFSPDEWESFTEEWASYLKNEYVAARRFGGSGDLGIDIAGFCSDKGFEAVWDNYQCKRYGHPLRPGSLFRILCKYLFSEVAVQAVTELDNKAAHCHTPVPQWHRPFL